MKVCERRKLEAEKAPPGIARSKLLTHSPWRSCRAVLGAMHVCTHSPWQGAQVHVARPEPTTLCFTFAEKGRERERGERGREREGERVGERELRERGERRECV